MTRDRTPPDLCASCGCLCWLPRGERRCRDCRGGRVTLDCEFCGRKFSLRPAQVNAGKRFCRDICQRGRTTVVPRGSNGARLAAKMAQAMAERKERRE